MKYGIKVIHTLFVPGNEERDMNFEGVVDLEGYTITEGEFKEVNPNDCNKSYFDRYKVKAGELKNMGKEGKLVLSLTAVPVSRKKSQVSSTKQYTMVFENERVNGPIGSYSGTFITRRGANNFGAGGKAKVILFPYSEK